MQSGLTLVLLLPLMVVALPNASQDSASVPKTLISLDWMYKRTPPPPPQLFLDESDQIVKEHWFEQNLDHFTSFKPKKWKQRYFRNDDYYMEGGPVFVFIFGQTEALPSWIDNSYMADLAERHGALALGLEHRYYGQSWPAEDASTQNLHYLHSEQALGDLENFIRQLRKQNETLDEAKWIVFGASYAGNLATWARMRYPDLIDGAVASSAYLLSKMDFEEYLEVVGMAIGKYNTKCLSDVRVAGEELESMLTSREGVDGINKIFHLCEPLNTSAENDISILETQIVSKFTDIVQYNTLRKNARSDVESLCSMFANSTQTSSLLRILDVVGVNESSCFDSSYDHFVALWHDDSLNGNFTRNGARQWLYQTCTQFGNFQTTSSKLQPFGHRLTLPSYINFCRAVFGPEITEESVEEAVNEVNQLYGGLTPNVTKVLFINGELDPWNTLGVMNDLNSLTSTIIIEGASHCSDVYAPNPADPPQLREAHKKIERQLNQWIRE